MYCFLLVYLCLTHLQITNSAHFIVIHTNYTFYRNSYLNYMNNSKNIPPDARDKSNLFKEEVTLNFNIDNTVVSISNIKAWTNFSKNEFLNKSLNEIFEGGILQKYIDAIELVKNGNIKYIYYQFKNHDYQVLLSPYYKEALYNGFIAIISRIKIKGKLSNYNEDYYSIFDDNKKCIVVYEAENKGQDFIIKSFNSNAEKLEKVNRFDVIGKNVVDVFPGIVKIGLLDVFKRVLKSGKTEKLEPFYYKDEREEGYRVNSVFKFSENKIIAVYDDITEEKELEDKLNSNHYEFELLNDLETEGIIFIKTDIIIKLNKKALDIFGYSNSSEIIGNHIYEFINTKYHKLIRKYLKNNKGEKFKVVGKHKANKELLIEGYSKKITYDDSGKIDVFFIKDTTKEAESNKKLKLLSTAVEQSANSVVITDIEGNIEYVNPYFTVVTGYSFEEAIGKNPRILKSGNQSNEFYKELWDTISKGEVWNEIFNNKTKDGRSYWEKANITPILDSKNHITNYIAIKENITKEYLQEIALESSEKKYRNLITNVSIPIVVINSSGKIDFINKSMYKLVGINYSGKEGLNTDYNVFDDIQLIRASSSAELKKIFEGKKAELPIINYKIENSRSNESSEVTYKELYLKPSAFPVKDENGAINQVVIMVEDLNKEKLNEITQSVIFNIIKAASRTESISELIKIIKIEIGRLLDTSNFFVGLYDEEKDYFTVPYFSDEKDKYNEFPAAKTLSKYVIETKKTLIASKEKKEQLKLEGKLITNGTESKIWLGIPLIVNNEAIGVYVVQNYEKEDAYTQNDIKLLEIIGEQISMSLYKKQIETNIIKKNKELETINKELVIAKEKAETSERLTNAFLANMSHEIRTPMNGIIGFTQLLQMPDIEKKEVNEYAQVIEQSGNRLLNTINELLDISKIEANKMSITKSKYNLNNQLVEIYRFFKNEAKNKLIDLIYNFNEGNKSLEVYTDSDKLQAILTNLIKNAIKYTKKGKIEFGYKIHKNEIEFYVSDTGIGIPKDRQKAIFDRFVQADIEDREVYEGAGLGLSITLAYVKMLDGEITVESKENKGSKFTVKIPMEIPKNIYEKSIEAIGKKEIKSKNRTHKLPINTLIVDDEKISYLYLSVALSEICQPLHYVQNAKEALELIEENKGIKLILMDIKMPKMNGFELTKIIKAKYPEIKVIAQTAFALQGDREKALEAGCDDYISKPVNYKMLKKIINRFFNVN